MRPSISSSMPTQPDVGTVCNVLCDHNFAEGQSGNELNIISNFGKHYFTFVCQPSVCKNMDGACLWFLKEVHLSL